MFMILYLIIPYHPFPIATAKGSSNFLLLNSVSSNTAYRVLSEEPLPGLAIICSTNFSMVPEGTSYLRPAL